MNSRFVPGFTVIAVALFIGGCSKKIPECNSIVDVVKVNAEKTMKGQDAAAFRGEADNADKAVASLGKLPLTLPELKKISGDLAAAYTAEGVAARKMATVTENLATPDAAEKAGVAAEDIKKSTEALEKAAGELDKFCAAN